jgi:hypothetical protein
MPWSRKLSAPITLDDGRVFERLHDAADYVLALPERRRADEGWQHAIRLMIKASEKKATAEDLAYVEHQLKIMLTADRVMGAPRPSLRRR